MPIRPYNQPTVDLEFQALKTNDINGSINDRIFQTLGGSSITDALGGSDAGGGGGGGSYTQNRYTGYIHLEGGGALDGSTKIEMSVWVKLALPASENQHIMGDLNDTYLRIDSGGTVLVRVEEAAGATLHYYRSNTTIPNDEWCHLYYAFDITAGTASLYINGVEDDGTGTEFTAPTAGTGLEMNNIDLLALNGTFLDFEGQWGDLWMNTPATFDGVTSFISGGAPTDLSGLGTPDVWLGGDQLAANIVAGENNGTETLTPRVDSTLTDV